MTKLPATLYVKTEQDGKISYFVADEDPHNLVEMGQKVKIGVYKLTKTQTGKGVVEIE